MSWLDRIHTDSGIWHGVEEYAQERIAELTAVCVSPASSDAQIRQAQAGIEEMNILLSIPARKAAVSQQMARSKQTTGY